MIRKWKLSIDNKAKWIGLSRGGKPEAGRGKQEEGSRKKEAGRGRREEGRGQRGVGLMEWGASRLAEWAWMRIVQDKRKAALEAAFFFFYYKFRISYGENQHAKYL